MPADDLRAAIDQGLRTRRFLGYYESREWALAAEPIIEDIRRAVETGPSDELVSLIQRAARLVVKVILHADDSDGMIGNLAHQLLDLHREACDAGVTNPIKLAHWMVSFCFDDQDFFELDPVRYAPILGEFGLAAYRLEVQQRAEVDEKSFALKYARERLAVLDGDIEEIVRLFGGDLSRPYDFIRLAEALEEIGRDDDVLVWAQRGIAETDGWQVAQLYDLVAGVYEKRGTKKALVELRREQHNRIPSTTSYNHLRGAADGAGEWESELPAARSVLGERNPGALVDVLLAEGELDAAWAVASLRLELDGDERRWMKLAESREASHPEDSLDIYLRLADRELETAGRSQYMRARSVLQRAARAASAAGRGPDFQEHMQTLRDRHRRRPTLIAIFDRAGLR